jgi:hypothetical protein
MAKAILIMGKSGTGKSYSLRNFADGEAGIINVLGKELPFRNAPKTYDSDNYENIKSALTKSKASTLVVDDAGYLITNEFMRRSNEKGYQKFTDLANNFFNLIMFIKRDLSDDKVVYLVMHEDEKEAGEVRPKTIGKLLDEKISIEGMFTIVLRSHKTQDGYFFRTQSDGYDVAKSPADMFDAEEIDNDLKQVNDIIREYYGIKEAE